MAIFLSDTFTDTNATLLQDHTPETGSTWSKASGFTDNATIDTNRVHCSGGTTLYKNAATPASADYYVSTIVDADPNGGTSGPAARIQASAGTCYWGRWSTSALQWKISKWLSGSLQDLAVVSEPGGFGGLKTLRLEVSGTNPVALTLYVDGVSTVTYSDTTDRIETAGVAGISIIDVTASVGCRVTSVTAGDLGATQLQAPRSISIMRQMIS